MLKSTVWYSHGRVRALKRKGGARCTRTLSSTELKSDPTPTIISCKGTIGGIVDALSYHSFNALQVACSISPIRSDFDSLCHFTNLKTAALL